MRDRTADPLRARQVLSQLSYSPIYWLFFLLLLISNTLPRRGEFCADGFFKKVKRTFVRESFKKNCQCKIGGSGRI